MHLKFGEVNEAYSNLVPAFSRVSKSTAQPGQSTDTVDQPINPTGRSLAQPANPSRASLIQLQGQHCPVAITQTRNGECVTPLQPVTISYINPESRVLMDPARDANPFLHYLETCWMFAGCNRLGPLSWLSENFSNYSDDGTTLHAAYGHRLQHGLSLQVGEYPFNSPLKVGPVNQLELALGMLRSDPSTRRIVLSLWDPLDLVRLSLYGNQMKDVACNTQCYLMVHQGYLNLTVLNRSNDLVWGSLGSNYVFFSYLLSLLAYLSELQVGEYHQISNNLHYYRTMDSKKLFSDTSPRLQCCNESEFSGLVRGIFGLSYLRTSCLSIINAIEFARNNSDPVGLISSIQGDSCMFLRDARRMVLAYHFYRVSNLEGALTESTKIEHQDWRVACINWIQRRIDRRAKKSKS